MRAIIFLILIFLSFVAKFETLACTTFCLNNGSQIVVAKNLDWETDLGFVFINKPDLHKVSFSDKRQKIEWISKYGSITFNQFGKEFPLGGMNDQGLVIEELNMSPFRFIQDSTKPNLNEFQLVQLLLDKCSCIEEVISQLDNLQLEPFLQCLHYFVEDSFGNNLIVEFNGNSFNYYFPNKTGYPILSNNYYQESVKYLANFQKFGGNLEVRRREGSNERFASVAKMLSEYNYQAPVSYSFNILDTVKQDDTRWSIVYDITNLKVYFKFHLCDKLKVFDLSGIFFKYQKSDLGSSISNCECIDEYCFHRISKDEITNYINQLYIELSKEININEKEKTFMIMAKYGNKYLYEM